MWQQEVLHRFTTLWIYTILKQCVLTIRNAIVSLPYGFTLFSNKVYDAYHALGFTTLWIYTILKQGQTLLLLDICFTTLWIYTILKHTDSLHLIGDGFTTLWIYTILKPVQKQHAAVCVSLPYGFTLFSNRFTQAFLPWWVSLPYGFTLFSNHRSRRQSLLIVSLPYGFTLFSNFYSTSASKAAFHYLMDLHYSQTSNKLRPLYSAGQIHKI